METVIVLDYVALLGEITLQTVSLILVSAACGQNQRVKTFFRVANLAWNPMQLVSKSQGKKG